MDNEEERIEPEPQIAIEDDLERAERFYTKLRRRISGWLSRRGKAGEATTPYLLLLPDLFTLLLRLIRDPRVGTSIKAQLLAATAYVISPIDLIPDFLLPLGLIDDTIAVALVLNRTVNMMDEAGEEILQEHWEGPGNVLAQVKRVLGAADNLIGGRVLGKLQGRFKGE